MRPKFAQLALVATLAIASSACHARFKKFARTADVVQMKGVVSSSAVVNLSESGGNTTGTAMEGLMDAAVGAAAQVSSAKIRKRLESVLAPGEVGAMVQAGATELVGEGPPFKSTGDPVDGTIQIEVTGYGITQSGGGPTFFANYRIRGYRADNGKKMYKTSASCSDRAFYTPNTPGNIVGTVATIAHLDNMSDEELRQMVEAVVQRCTSRVVAKMRKHAG